MSATKLIHPEAPKRQPVDGEHARMWGFADSRFVADAEGIRMASTRYDVGGHLLPNLTAFVEKAVGVPFDANSRHEPVQPVVPPSHAGEALVAALAQVLGDRVSLQDSVRLRHGHGHHLEEIYKVLFERLERVPDVVVWPETDDEVRAVLEIARGHQARVVPFGGGTCVSMALACPEQAHHCIISLDLSRMNRIVWLDPVSRTACIEGGAVGRTLQAQLAEHGFTLGHEPDSIEFSTLGGWIATNASGMKKNRYGNIEDIVLDVTVVGSAGPVEHPVNVPRASHGLDARRLVIGSEGMLGVITRATVKVHRLPEIQRYGSLVFRDFDTALAFFEELSQWQTLPASVRLVDNLQLQFGRALKPAAKNPLASWAQRVLLTKVKGFDLERIVACTIVYEGDSQEQADLERRVNRLATRFGGLAGGSSAGKDGYNLTFGIAYIRDFLLQHWTLGDSFETSAPWGRVQDVISGVKDAVSAAHARHELPGKPFVTARVSQLYQTGCCIYFYIGFHYRGVADPLSAFRDIEHDARLAILDAGGSLSHHHGIGKVRADYLSRIKSAGALAWAASAQQALDPDGLFVHDNQGITRPPSTRPPNARPPNTRPPNTR